jgi:hypothetical protein
MEWGEGRLMDEEEAIETKAEQALLEIEHLVSGASDVEFAVEGDVIRHEPSEELEGFLERQSDESGLEPEELLRLHADLFARVFLEDAEDDGGTADSELPDDPRPDRR